VVTKAQILDHLYTEPDEPGGKIIDVFVCNLRKKLALATGGEHCIETAWGRGYVLRDPTPAADATSAVASKGKDPRLERGNATAAGALVGRKFSPPPPRTAADLGLVEQRQQRRDSIGNHPAIRRRRAGIAPSAKVTGSPITVEILFEDAVTKDDGPLHLPRPERVRSLYGCATARCHE